MRKRGGQERANGGARAGGALPSTFSRVPAPPPFRNGPATHPRCWGMPTQGSAGARPPGVGGSRWAAPRKGNTPARPARSSGPPLFRASPFAPPSSLPPSPSLSPRHSVPRPGGPGASGWPAWTFRKCRPQSSPAFWGGGRKTSGERGSAGGASERQKTRPGKKRDKADAGRKRGARSDGGLAGQGRGTGWRGSRCVCGAGRGGACGSKGRVRKTSGHPPLSHIGSAVNWRGPAPHRRGPARPSIPSLFLARLSLPPLSPTLRVRVGLRPPFARRVKQTFCLCRRLPPSFLWCPPSMQVRFVRAGGGIARPPTPAFLPQRDGPTG